VTNSYITDASYGTFPIRRRDEALYVENRFEFGGRLFLERGRARGVSGDGRDTDGWVRAAVLSGAEHYGGESQAVRAYLMGRTRFHASLGRAFGRRAVRSGLHR